MRTRWTVVVKNFRRRRHQGQLEESRSGGSPRRAYNANEIDWYFYWAGRGAAPMLEPCTWLGQQNDIPFAWALASGGATRPHPNAMEPPKDYYIRKVWELWDKIALEPDEKKRTEMFNQIIDIFTTRVAVHRHGRLAGAARTSSRMACATSAAGIMTTTPCAMRAFSCPGRSTGTSRTSTNN